MCFFNPIQTGNTMLKPLIASLAATLIASPALATNVDAGHYALTQAIVATGVDLKINAPNCFTDTDAFGWYWAVRSELVICQENATQVGVEVHWTAEDFDTLRHEAHHLAQDCVDGLTDGDIQNIYKDSPAFVTSVLSQRLIGSVIDGYIDKGEATVRTELEAFAVAAVNDTAEQVRDIKNYCF